MSIRFNHSRPSRGNTSYYSFTFLADDHTVQQQFEAMAARIQRELTMRYVTPRVDMIVEFYPQNGVANILNTVRFIHGITGNYLMDIYSNILRSQETIQLEGTRIRIKIIGHRMRRGKTRGRGRIIGSNYVPQKFKGLGIGK